MNTVPTRRGRPDISRKIATRARTLAHHGPISKAGSKVSFAGHSPRTDVLSLRPQPGALALPNHIAAKTVFADHHVYELGIGGRYATAFALAQRTNARAEMDFGSRWLGRFGRPPLHDG